jgi:hypothetical protein
MAKIMSADGVGIMLGPFDDDYQLGGVDLDTCIGEGGALAPWASAILDILKTYSEISPSGKGLKAVFLVSKDLVRPFLERIGVKPEKWGCKRGLPGTSGANHGPAVEIYFSHRYFTVTGNRFAGAPAELAVLDEATLARLAPLIPQGEERGEDEQPANGGDTSSANGKDTSRSAEANRLGWSMYFHGKSFDEFRDAVRTDKKTASWFKDWAAKGDKELQRQLDNIWQDAAAAKTDRGGAVDEMNRSYAVVMVSGKAAILHEYTDAEGDPAFDLMSMGSLRLKLANKFVAGADPTKRIPLADCWCTRPNRRTYEGIVFLPKQQTPGFYNLWKGFSVEPSPNGSCDKFKEHLLTNVSQSSLEIYLWVFGWFADMFQNPGVKCGTSLALRGDQGTAKTIVGKTIGQLFRSHYVPVAQPRYVTSRFNSHMERCILLHADEAFWAGDHEAESKIKDLVTGDQHPIERKGYEALFVRNFVRLFATGNPKWLVPAAFDERRFATLDVGEKHKQDIPYFKAIDDELKSGGAARLLYELLEFDLTQVDLRTIPRTAALLDQKIESMNAEESWWLDVLNGGCLPVSGPGAVGFSSNKCPTEWLVDSYQQHAKESGARRRQTETALGIFLNGMVPGLIKERETYTTGHGMKHPKKNVYTFPPLGTCRLAFEKKLQQQVPWGMRLRGGERRRTRSSGGSAEARCFEVCPEGQGVPKVWP